MRVSSLLSPSSSVTWITVFAFFAVAAAVANLGPVAPWADAPMPLVTTPRHQTNKTDIFTTSATHMCLVHNAILRGYNTIYHQAALIQDADKADFIGYCLTWFKFVKSHHDDEEETFFPKVEGILKDKEVWGNTHEEHESFLKGLGEFHDYLASLKSPTNFSGARLLEIMATFEQNFAHHFHSEIATIAALADHPNAPPPGSEEAVVAGTVLKTWGKATVSKAGAWDVVPFFLMNLDRSPEYEDGRWTNWPPISTPIRQGLTNIAISWYGSWWRFSSCNSTGLPQTLYALRSKAGKATPKVEAEAEL